MAEVGIIAASSLLPSSAALKPPPPPNRCRIRSPHLRPPLLSDAFRDLTAPPQCHQTASPSPPSTRRLLKYYARLASTLAQAGRLRDFLMIAESVITSDAVASERPQFMARVDTRLVAQGISSVLRDSRLEEVLDFLRDAEKLGICPSSLFDNSAMEALAAECRRLVKEGRLEEFVASMEALAGYGFFVRDIANPVDILKIVVEKRDPNMAIRYASIFPHSQLLFCSVIQEFGVRKDISSAIAVFEAAKQRPDGISMFACRNMIDICGFCGNYLKARSIFEDLLARKISPNIYVVNSLLNVNAHDLSYTLYVYKHMQHIGVTADLASYNIILKACCTAKRVDLAKDIYKEIKCMESEGALKLDIITYSSMIKVFADAKLWEMALNIKEDMLLADIAPNVVTWSSLISCFSNAGLVDHAVQIFEEMLLVGCEPNDYCWNAVLNACVASCQYDRAFRFFRDWKVTGFKICRAAKPRKHDGTHAALVIKHPTGNDSSHLTCSTCDSEPPSIVVPFKPTVATFNILMKACGTDHYRAKALMDEMKTMALSPNHISWSILIDIYGNSKNMRDAMKAFKAMRDAGIKLDVIAYTTAIKASVKNKNLKSAFSLFKEMKRYRLQPNSVTYNTLLKARSRYGSLREVQQCLAIYQDMRKAGYSANDYYLKGLIEEWCEGVICGSNQNQGHVSISKVCMHADNKKPPTLLLEKVATHLQKDGGDNQAIDIRGLSKIEARIVILSVLRMIKENYRLGKVVKNDMIIISGTRKEAVSPSNHEFEVQLGILQVLQVELGLDVMTDHRATVRNNSTYQNDLDHPVIIQNTELLKDYKHLTRRPHNLGILKVTRTSLCNWLQKKVVSETT